MSKRTTLAAAATVLLVTVVLPSVAMAQTITEAESNASDITMWVAIACGFGMSIASSVCGFAQSRCVTAACEGMARNPSASTSIKGTLIIGLVLIESLAIYSLLVAILLMFMFQR